MNKSEIVYAFQNLIVYFLERQRLVMLAMLDVSPVLLTMDGADILSIDLTPYIELFQEKHAHIQDPMDMYQGIWKRDWKYRLHGIGCKLTHIHTNEPLEWDAPNSHAFRFDWFWEHLMWRMEFEAQDPYVMKCSAYLRGFSKTEVKTILMESGVLIKRRDGLCLLRLTE